MGIHVEVRCLSGQAHEYQAEIGVYHALGRGVVFRWPVTATITLSTNSIEQILLNKWSIEQNQTNQMASLTNSY